MDHGNASDPGPPPIDAARVLNLPTRLPETVSDFNGELLAVGQHLVESLPDEPDAHSQMAFACMELGQHDDAIEAWNRALRKDESYTPAHLGIAALRAERGENEEAVTGLRHTIKLAPESEEAYQLLVEVLLRQGEAEESLAVAEECARRFPKNYENHFWLGQAYLEHGEYGEARRCHEEAIRLNPDWTQSYYSLSVACARLGDREDAQRYREKFAELKSIDQTTDREQTRAYDDLSSRRRAVIKQHILAGAMELRFDHLQTAEAHWLRVCRIDPTNIPTREALILLYQRQGRTGAALQVLGELVQLAPDNAEYLLDQGRLLFDLERWREAETKLKQVLELKSDSAEANLRLAQIHLRTDTDMAVAQSYAEKAVDLAPTVNGLRILAAIRAQKGDFSGARSAMKQALSMAPYDATLREAYEQLLKMD